MSILEIVGIVSAASSLLSTGVAVILLLRVARVHELVNSQSKQLNNVIRENAFVAGKAAGKKEERADAVDSERV